MLLPNIKTGIASLKRWILAVLRRQPTLVSDEVLAERLETCRPCRFLSKRSRQCRKCTCFVDIKANLSTERCPVKKWKR